MQRKAERVNARRKTSMPYVTSEMTSIMERVGHDIDDREMVESMHFSPTALTMVRHVMMTGGTIVTDTTLTMGDIDREMADKLGVSVRCFIDDPQIMEIAEQKRVTRAEVALDFALSLPGLKLLAVGSAPMALNRLLQRVQTDPPADVVVLAAPTGFASVVQAKERVWESKIPAIVVRGKKGGAAVTVSIINALMAESIREQNL